MASFFLAKIYFKIVEKAPIWLKASGWGERWLYSVSRTLRVAIIRHILKRLQSYSGVGENLRRGVAGHDGLNLSSKRLRHSAGLDCRQWASEC